LPGGFAGVVEEADARRGGGVVGAARASFRNRNIFSLRPWVVVEGGRGKEETRYKMMEDTG
jgi:hypothetical protein